MKIIAVTGGAQGIGRAIAFHFARACYGVSVPDLDEEAGEETIRKLRQMGAGAVFVRADVSEPRDAESWMQLTAQDLGCPDVLVNNAGIARNAPFLQLAPADFDRVIAVNLRGTFLCSQVAARRMIDHAGGGAIVNIASTRAFMSEPGTEAYTASKGGIVALTHALASASGPTASA